MTNIELFRENAYLTHCTATVTHAIDGAVVLDQTVFYPQGGGQPGDTGTLELADGRKLAVCDTRKSQQIDGAIEHVVQDLDATSVVGQQVVVTLDWERRYRLMRMHTCMHLLCAVVEGGVTGGSIRDGSARLDFDLPDVLLDKEDITRQLNDLVARDALIKDRWITEAELDAKPDMVRTMSVQPPRGHGQIRVVEITDIDLQPCGGTHVRRTGEVGPVRVKKIEKKGKHNRRVNVVFDG